MALLNYTKARTALMLGGSLTLTANEYPTYMMIGSGSGTAYITQTALLAARDRQAVTSTTNAPYTITWQGDWNSVEISGTQLREFGMCGSATGITGSMWSRTTTPNIIFDGTNELQIVETWEVF